MVTSNPSQTALPRADRPQAAFLFPTGFLWGTATAAHQVEGSNTNNTWHAWEQQEGRIAQGHKSGLACDWWGGRWKEDFDRAAEAHQNAHRLSVEWSRIQPAPDRWDENALDRYREMVRGLVDRGMTPMVTLHHFTDPLWLMDLPGGGGWESPETPELFATFARKVVQALSEYVSLWVTINEPNVYAFGGYLGGGFPPGKSDLNTSLMVTANLVRGHALAYRAIHAAQPYARVGFAHNYRSLIPTRSWLPLDTLPARAQGKIYNDLFPRALVDGRFDAIFKRFKIPEAAGTQDFLGVNYYSRDYVSFSLRHRAMLFGKRSFRKGVEVSDTGFLANEPEGMFEALKWGRQFNVPMIVTENGVENADDRLRQRYTLEHLHQIWRAVNFNWPVKGYFHWSLVDNFEWERGWTQRFGLWELDETTQARRKRPSVNMYGEICEANGITMDTVARYAPDLLPKLFDEAGEAALKSAA